MQARITFSIENFRESTTCPLRVVDGLYWESWGNLQLAHKESGMGMNSCPRTHF